MTWAEPGDLTACGPGTAGCAWLRPECGDFTATVVRLEPATSSALAHELCHAAGVPEDDAPTCAAEINASLP